jgi:hypothetical protein
VASQEVSAYPCGKPILVGTAAGEVDEYIKVVPVGSPTGAHFFQKPLDK